MTIRYLRSGDTPPEGEPRRYLTAAGYVHLRWRLDTGEYVGCFEHRLVAQRTIGRPLLPGEHVHHRNHDRADNRPENLEVLTAEEHTALHKAEAAAKTGAMVDLYAAGLTMAQIADRLAVHPSTISRHLDTADVSKRSAAEVNTTPVDDDLLVEMHGAGCYRVRQIADALGVSQAVVRRRMVDLGLPSFPAGNPRLETVRG